MYRLRPERQDTGVVAPFIAGPTLFGPALTRQVIAARTAAGAEFLLRPRDGTPEDGSVLFVLRDDGRLLPSDDDGPPAPEPGDRLVLLGPVLPSPRRPERQHADGGAPDGAGR